MYQFNYQRPNSVADAVAALKSADDGKAMAGGHTLIPTLKQRLARPSDLVDLSGIAELTGVEASDGSVRVGAMTTHGAVAGDSTVNAKIPALAKLAGGIGDPQVRTRGTMGGSIANNDPAADYPAAVLGLDATVITDRREIAADDFFVGMFETALDEGEIIRAVSFKVPDQAAYAKFANPASRYAIVGVFVARFDDAVRVAVTGAGPGVFRASDFESALGGSFAASALEGISVAADDLNSDIHASAEYRAHLVGVMAKRAVAAA